MAGSSRNVAVKFTAEIQNFKRAMQEAAEETRKVKKASEEAGKQAEQNAQELAKTAQAHQDAAKAVGLQYDKTGQLVTMNGKAVSSQQAAAHGLEAFSKEAYLAGKAAEDAANLTSSSFEKMAEKAELHRGEWEQAGGVMLGFGAATLAGLGLATKAAIDWESAWAGVTKTVDGSPEQMAALEEELRGLAKTLPATHEEIAGVAEAAGQLGVAREDITSFTKTMIDLSETTNLSTDEAATSIAQMMNVMQTAPDDVDNLGAALVALGNDGASTEADIINMAQRLAGVGKVVGATEADVLAMANAMASVGISAELGGGAMSRVMQDIFAEVKNGGDKLEGFAEVAGMSASDYAKAFEEDPMRATDAFVQGLGRISDSGGNVIGTLSDLGIKSTEETRTLLSLAGAGDLLTKSLDLGATAWEENSALAVEAQKRYETTEAKIQIAWNTIKDAAIDAGAVIVPVVAGAAEAVANLATWFSELPAPVQGALTGLAGVTGAAALAAGAFLTLFPRIVDTIGAFKTVRTDFPKSATAIGKVGKAAGIAAVAVIGLQAAGMAARAAFDDGVPSVQEFSNELLKMGEGGSIKGLDDMVARTGFLSTTINGVGDAVSYVGSLNGFDKLSLSVSGTLNLPSHMQDIVDSVEGVDASLGQLVTGGNTDEAAAAFKQIATEAVAQGMEIGEVLDIFPQYRDALIESANAAGGSADKQEILNAALGESDPAAVTAAAAQEIMAGAVEETGVAVDGVVESMDTFLEQLFEAGILTMSSRDAQAAYQEQLDSVDAAIKTITESGGEMGATLNKNKTDFDLSTEAGRLANDTFQGLARGGMDEVKALAEEGLGQDVLQGKLSGTYDDLIATAGQFGITGGEAEALARKVLGVPDGVSVDSWMDGEAKRMAEATEAKLNDIDGRTVNTYAFHHNTQINEVVYRQTNEMNKTPEKYGGRTSTGPGGAGGLTRASGGAIFGPGSGTSDSIPALLSNGEHVLTASEVQTMGGHQAVYSFRESLRGASVPRYASGGHVGREYAAPAAYSSGSGGMFSLDPEDRALLRSVAGLATRPVRVESRLAIGDRDAGHIVSRGQVANKRMGGR